MAVILAQLNHMTPVSKIWSLVRSLSDKRSCSLPVLRINGMNIVEPVEIVNAVAGNISHCSSSANYSPEFVACSRQEFALYPHLFDSDNAEVYNVNFTMTELRDAISSAGNTSTDPDNLHYEFFRDLPENTLRFILLTFNDLWNKQVFPGAWREASVPRRCRHFRHVEIQGCRYGARWDCHSVELLFGWNTNWTIRHSITEREV